MARSKYSPAPGPPLNVKSIGTLNTPSSTDPLFRIARALIFIPFKTPAVDTETLVLFAVSRILFALDTGGEITKGSVAIFAVFAESFATIVACPA